MFPYAGPDIPPDMIELLRRFEVYGKEIERLTARKAQEFRTGLIPRAWTHQRDLDSFTRQRGELLPQIDERARALLAAALDPCHGEDPTLAEEIRLYTLWKLTPRA